MRRRGKSVWRENSFYYNSISHGCHFPFICTSRLLMSASSVRENAFLLTTCLRRVNRRAGCQRSSLAASSGAQEHLLILLFASFYTVRQILSFSLLEISVALQTPCCAAFGVSPLSSALQPHRSTDAHLSPGPSGSLRMALRLGLVVTLLYHLRGSGEVQMTVSLTVMAEKNFSSRGQ